jgi:hypothetical protein
MRSTNSFVIPGLTEREPGTQGQTHRRGNGLRKAALAVALLMLTACGTSSAPGPGDPGPDGTAPPIPLDGPIAYRCSDGTQLMVEATGSQARVAIVGGPSMVLPSAGDGYYSNGRYGFRGGGASGQWEVGRAAPVACRGS